MVQNLVMLSLALSIVYTQDTGVRWRAFFMLRSTVPPRTFSPLSSPSPSSSSPPSPSPHLLTHTHSHLPKKLRLEPERNTCLLIYCGTRKLKKQVSGLSGLKVYLPLALPPPLPPPPPPPFPSSLAPLPLPPPPPSLYLHSLHTSWWRIRRGRT